MALKTKDARGNSFFIHLEKWVIDQKKAKGVLVNSELGVFEIGYPLDIVNEVEKYSESEIFLFKNKFGIKEDQCFNVYVNGNRNGVVFPIKLYSNPSILPPVGASKDVDFLYRFLFIAFYLLLDSKGISSKPIDFGILSGDGFKIEDFYDEETVIFLHHNSSAPVDKLDINLLYPSLLKLGYVPILEESDYDNIDFYSLSNSQHPLQAHGMLSAINLKFISAELKGERYIEQFFKSIVKLRITPLSKFILLYQIVELIIDKIALEIYRSKNIFGINTSMLMMKADKANSFRDTYDYLFEILKLINNTSEETKKELPRINKLVNDRSKLDINDYSDFVTKSKVLISAKKDPVTLSEHIYWLRNKIIHDYHSVSIKHANADELLNEINILFEKVICDIVIQYKT